MKTCSLKQQDNFAQGFNVIAKPIGPVCNLDCKYCFYTEKHALFPKDHNYRISDEVLEEIRAQENVYSARKIYL